MISPFFVGMIADRFFATERVLAVLHLLGAVDALRRVATDLDLRRVLSGTHRLRALLHADARADQFDLLPQHEGLRAEFPRVRVLGTIGWIVAGLLVGRLGLEATAMPMRIAAAASLVLAAFCLHAAAHTAARCGHGRSARATRSASTRSP
jgi:hypothetical protein